MALSSHESSSQEWSFGEIYGKAYRIATKYPVLWWFALAIGAGSFFNGSGGGSSSSSSSNNSDTLLQHSDKQSALPLAKVLGAATDATADLWTQIAHAIPWYFYAVLIGEVLVLVIFAVVVSIIYRAWAQASLLHGIESAIKDEKPDMADMSEKAFANIKSIIWLEIVPSLAFWLISVPLLGMLIFFLFVFPGSLKIFAGLLLFVGIIVFITALLFMTMASIWAPRKVILDNISAYEAFLSGLRITKKKFWKTLLYGIFNVVMELVILALVVIIPLIILILLGTVVFLIIQSSIPLIIFVSILLAALIVVWIVAFTLLTGVITTFKTAVWSIAYHKIRGKYD
jgi:hypothetical protein